MSLNKTSFDIINHIDINNENTWEDKFFLTFDIDWASDEVFEYTIDIIEKANVCATWFITHYTPLLKRLRENPKFELGIHPNFNYLLVGDKRNGATAVEVVDRLMQIVPEAKSVRSHSLTQSSILLNIFKEKGLKFHCNTLIPFNKEVIVKPAKLWNNMVDCPHIWEDDVACLNKNFNPIDVSDYKGLKIFDFHPIHVFLNTEKIEQYEKAKNYQQKFEELKKYINTRVHGTKDYLLNLLNKNSIK